MSSASVLLRSAQLQLAESIAVPSAYAAATIPGFSYGLIVLSLATTPEEGTRNLAGAAIFGFWSASIWGAGSVLRRERAYGTLVRLVHGTTRPLAAVVGKAMGAGAFALAMAAVSVGLAVVVVRPPLVMLGIAESAAGIGLLLLSGSALGILFGGLFIVSRYASRITALLLYPVAILSGLLVAPVGWAPMRILAGFVSLSWIRQYFDDLIVGRWTAWPLLAAGALTAAYAIAATLFLALAVRRSRSGDKLGLY